MQLEDAPHDYQSLANAITNGFGDKAKTETSSCGYANYRVLNKRLSRVILYGRKQADLVDRTTILQRCVEEIGRVRDSDKSECGTLRNISIVIVISAKICLQLAYRRLYYSMVVM